MTILVDHRERSSGVIDTLRAIGVHVEAKSLPLADFVVAPGVGVERKSIVDLHRSIASGRLWTQVASLRADLATAFLLVEGDDLDRGPLSRGGVRGALLEVTALGVPVIRSRDVDDSAQWLVRIAMRTSRRGVPRSPRRTRPGPRATPETILSATPGVSPRIAAALIDRFGSVAAVAAAPEGELALVRGIGPIRARSLRQLFSKEP